MQYPRPGEAHSAQAGFVLWGLGRPKALGRMTCSDWIPYEKHEGSGSSVWLLGEVGTWLFPCSNPVLVSLEESQSFQ